MKWLTISPSRRVFTFQLANIATNTLNENDGQFTEPSNQDEVMKLDHFPKYGWTLKTCAESQLPWDFEDSLVLKRSSFSRKIPSSLAPNCFQTCAPHKSNPTSFLHLRATILLNQSRALGVGSILYRCLSLLFKGDTRCPIGSFLLRRYFGTPIRKPFPCIPTAADPWIYIGKQVTNPPKKHQPSELIFTMPGRLRVASSKKTPSKKTKVRWIHGQTFQDLFGQIGHCFALPQLK